MFDRCTVFFFAVPNFFLTLKVGATTTKRSHFQNETALQNTNQTRKDRLLFETPNTSVWPRLEGGAIGEVTRPFPADGPVHTWSTASEMRVVFATSLETVFLHSLSACFKTAVVFSVSSHFVVVPGVRWRSKCRDAVYSLKFR